MPWPCGVNPVSWLSRNVTELAGFTPIKPAGTPPLFSSPKLLLDRAAASRGLVTKSKAAEVLPVALTQLLMVDRQAPGLFWSNDWVGQYSPTENTGAVALLQVCTELPPEPFTGS